MIERAFPLFQAEMTALLGDCLSIVVRIDRKPGAPCPYGTVGDRLWVQEPWASADTMYHDYDYDVPQNIAYFADKSAVTFPFVGGRPIRVPPNDTAAWNWLRLRRRPATQMSRWASRRTVRIVGIQQRRLQDITEHEARRAGVALVPCPHPDCDTGCAAGGYREEFLRQWTKAYRHLLGAERPLWLANPRVWLLGIALPAQPRARG